MPEITIEQQLAKIIEQNEKILSNQQSLQGLICIVGNFLYSEKGNRALFESMVKVWPIKH